MTNQNINRIRVHAVELHGSREFQPTLEQSQKWDRVGQLKKNEGLRFSMWDTRFTPNPPHRLPLALFSGQSEDGATIMSCRICKIPKEHSKKAGGQLKSRQNQIMRSK